MSIKYDIKDAGLAEKGRLRTEWSEREMPVLNSVKERFTKDKPLDGVTIAACLHVTAETGNLMKTLQASGAKAILCASNPLSTQDDVAAHLVDVGIPVYAVHGADNTLYYEHISKTLDYKPELTIDDGADLVALLHTKRTELLENIRGGMEETTTGVIRLRALAKSGVLKYPIVAVNDSDTKHLFDNRYGTGQSTMDGILRATNILLAGKTVTVIGYGWCGRGISARASGMGAQTIVCEVDPIRSLEALMDGHRVMELEQAVKVSDIVVTATGNKHTVDAKHIAAAKDGLMIANSGHFNVEINIDALQAGAKSVSTVRESVEEYAMKDGRSLYLLGEGRLINLAAAEGHPASVMDLSFANQALACEYIYNNGPDMKSGVYRLPVEIDREIARLKLVESGVNFDTLTAEQQEYLESWEIGT